tara:strand:- start:1563 stop:1778 length:216 start_codon:yes stop_codon:yes gene_type:complete
MEDIIKKIIVDSMPDAICLFEGDSCNLRLIVISSDFKELSLINQHKKIMKLLEDKFQSGDLHALSLETRTS